MPTLSDVVIIGGGVIGSAIAYNLQRSGAKVTVLERDRIAAGALPVVGAVGGATINVVFMNHFQQVAAGHFAVRRLERQYGAETGRF